MCVVLEVTVQLVAVPRRVRCERDQQPPRDHDVHSNQSYAREHLLLVYRSELHASSLDRALVGSA